MAESLNIGLDLGNDTLKIAYAYQKDGEVVYGKIAHGDYLTRVAIPAVAYYDEEAGKWLYGEEVEKVESSFVNVVKIKSLVSLLHRSADDRITACNREYYFNGNRFPKFFFPVRRKMLEDFGGMVEADMTFEAFGFTPAAVCEGFFSYVSSVATARVSALMKERKISSKDVRVALVYPPKVGKEYVAELSRLVTRAFSAPCKVLSSTKALGMFAVHRGAITGGEKVLVFDMGDEDISVAKVQLLGSSIVVDGADGHSAPLALGGADVDEAVLANIEEQIRRRETVGTPSYGEEGHINEQGLDAKQYLLMKEIKKAKIILSRPLRDGSVFRNGVPIGISRDLYIQRKIDRDTFVDCVGVTGGDGVADAVVNYILEEIRLPANYDVKKIFLSGGLTETYALLDYIRGRLSASAPEVRVGTFDDNRETGDGFVILSHEDSIYAPAVGGAIVALKNLEVKTVLTLSYGTWAVDPYSQKKSLTIIANKGSVLKDEGDLFKKAFQVTGAQVLGEEMFSVVVAEEDIRERKIKDVVYSQGGSVIIGDEGTQARKKAQEKLGLVTVAGGEDAKILFYHQGMQVALYEQIDFMEGIRVDGDGRAEPVIQNISEAGQYVNLQYVGSQSKARVPASEIELRFEGLKGFVIVTG